MSSSTSRRKKSKKRGMIGPIGALPVASSLFFSQARTHEYQVRQRQLKAQVREISSQVMGVEPLIQRGGFKPFLKA